MTVAIAYGDLIPHCESKATLQQQEFDTAEGVFVLEVQVLTEGIMKRNSTWEKFQI